ncbi:FkbM family methyltransferase [Phyllobacterium sp. 1468]|uniref:FkbM family methyltransferase n=1 Tax=Phyllobacterium sp. 1468 TaxID=2817759 RepID=UPI002861850E|nr:FkbM family methyltransferase [Phyllobacterium sp. 1468]MDR6635542.1 FkbM family methyltransferase [Phyllobacterium sp. 1468]
MPGRTVWHRTRDLGRLFYEFGPGMQPLRFLWNLGNGASPERTILFRVRSLGHQPISVRPGTSDLVVLYETFGASYDAPPPILSREKATRIWDLGANIGLTVALYAAAFPLARISAVELDAANADLARINTITFGSRCEIITGAVWFEDAEIDYIIETGMEHGAHVTEATNSTTRKSPAWSLNTLFKNDDLIDFVKMDIEGAEALVLTRNTEWSTKVACLKVECHSPYTVTQAVADLEPLGYEVDQESTHWASVVAIKPFLKN